MISVVFLAGVIGGILGLLHGGNIEIDIPRWAKNCLWALPFGICVWIFQGWFFGTLAFALCLLKCIGHGRGTNLPEPMDGPPETWEFLIAWAQKHLTVFQYKLLILAVAGVLAVSGGLLLGGWSAFIILIGGLMKPLMYLAGWRLFPAGSGKPIFGLDQATKIGEFGSGFAAFAALAAACII